MDATIVRAHQHSAVAQHSSSEKEAIGRSKGGLSTKIHTVTDVLGNPTHFFTPGQDSDLAGADALFPQLQAKVLLDALLYQARHLIENFFAKLKQFRAIATRYDKRVVNFLGRLYLVASSILLA